jgi:hypothetical protein
MDFNAGKSQMTAAELQRNHRRNPGGLAIPVLCSDDGGRLATVYDRQVKVAATPREYGSNAPHRRARALPLLQARGSVAETEQRTGCRRTHAGR